MADAESVEFTRGGAAVDSSATNAIAQSLADFLQKGFQFCSSSFGNQFHPAIGEVLHETRDSMFASDSFSRVAESYSLDTAGIENLASLVACSSHFDVSKGSTQFGLHKLSNIASKEEDFQAASGVIVTQEEMWKRIFGKCFP